jgi:hypothetical protein
MSSVTPQPEALTSATGTLQGIGSSVGALDAAAVAIREMFANTLGISAGSHAAAESANAIATSGPILLASRLIPIRHPA